MLNSDKFLDAIRAGKKQFIARFAKRDNKDGDGPEWSDYDQGLVILRATIRQKDIRHGGRTYPKGQIISLYSSYPKGWAEYSEDDYCGNGEFLAEEYRMQLLEVVE